MRKGPQGQKLPGPNLKELDHLLYVVMDKIQHDWTRGPVEMEPRVKFLFLTQLRATRDEIDLLLGRLEQQDA